MKRYGVGEAKGTGGQVMPFARAVEADGWLYVSGQTPMVNGEVVEGGIVTQSKQAIENVIAILKRPRARRALRRMARRRARFRVVQQGLHFVLRRAPARPRMRAVEHGDRLQGRGRLHRVQGAGEVTRRAVREARSVDG
ncbi:endoribonuclease L-PSP [Burkholderia pseudomallei]|nr:endoribonuclease L-PSP [Burkholderia pseudomallei]VCJ14176.1 endoribonuclease L-PSP [Burkholderia pseudomallei]